MKERYTHIRAPGELTLPLEELQSGDEILLSEMQKTHRESNRQICTSQATLIFEDAKEFYGEPAIAVTAESRVGEAANEFPKGELFLIPLEEDGTIPLDNGLTIVTHEEGEPTTSTIGGDWTRLRVFRPQRHEQSRKVTPRGLGKRALIPSTFLGFKD